MIFTLTLLITMGVAIGCYGVYLSAMESFNYRLEMYGPEGLFDDIF